MRQKLGHFLKPYGPADDPMLFEKKTCDQTSDKKFSGDLIDQKFKSVLTLTLLQLSNQNN